MSLIVRFKVFLWLTLISKGVFDDVVLEAAQKFIFKKDGTTYYADEVFVFIIDP